MRTGPKRFLALSGAALSIFLVGACGGSPKPTPGPTAAPPTTPTATATTSPAAAAKVTKVLVFIAENKSFDEMKDEMPFTFAVAQKYGFSSNFTAIRHPSLPNYIALASGSTQGITDDATPPSHRLAVPSIFGQAIAKGRTAGTYADGMATPCDINNGGNRYAARHNPWTYFTRERADCKKYDVPFTNFANDVATGRLPNLALVVPNTCHDAHDAGCDLRRADDWIKARMHDVFRGPDWKAGRLAVIMTADEDDRKAGNHILTVVAHPSQHHHVVTTPLTTYSLSGLLSDITHAPRLGKATSAPSMAEAFALPIG
jgi:acid phosphatase